MELKETINLMNSPEYKERFQAEYWQLRIRYEKLQLMLEMWDNGTLSFTPTCPRDIYDIQIHTMKDYLAVLEERSRIENIEL